MDPDGRAAMVSLDGGAKVVLSPKIGLLPLDFSGNGGPDIRIFVGNKVHGALVLRREGN